MNQQFSPCDRCPTRHLRLEIAAGVGGKRHRSGRWKEKILTLCHNQGSGHTLLTAPGAWAWSNHHLGSPEPDQECSWENRAMTETITVFTHSASASAAAAGNSGALRCHTREQGAGSIPGACWSQFDKSQSCIKNLKLNVCDNHHRTSENIHRQINGHMEPKSRDRPWLLRIKISEMQNSF